MYSICFLPPLLSSPSLPGGSAESTVCRQHLSNNTATAIHVCPVLLTGIPQQDPTFQGKTSRPRKVWECEARTPRSQDPVPSWMVPLPSSQKTPLGRGSGHRSRTRQDGEGDTSNTQEKSVLKGPPRLGALQGFSQERLRLTVMRTLLLNVVCREMNKREGRTAAGGREDFQVPARWVHEWRTARRTGGWMFVLFPFTQHRLSRIVPQE